MPEPKISLFPEKSREELEFQLHWTTAALRLAASMLVVHEDVPGTGDEENAVIQKIDYLLDHSLDMAAKAGVVRAARNERAAMQRADSKSRGRIPVFINLLLLTLALGAHRVHAQRKVDFALYAADATVRSLDTWSTHRLLDAPCRCFHEDDPLAPHTRRVLPLLSFQAAMSAGLVSGGRRLAARGHARLGRVALVADLAGETWAVQHNLRQHAPAPRSGLTGGGLR